MHPTRFATCLLALLLSTRCGGEGDTGDSTDAADSPGTPDTADTRPIGAEDRSFDLPVPADFAPHPTLGVVASRRHLIVVADPATTSATTFAALAADVGATLGGYVAGAGVAQLVLPPAVADFALLDTAREHLASRAEVLGVALDLPLGPSYLPAGWSDPLGPAGHLFDMGVPSAWNLIPRLAKQSPRPDVRVAVIDVGFAAHPDLAGVLSAPPSTSDHGTAVAGLIGARHAAATAAMGASPFVTIEGFEVTSLFKQMSLSASLELLLAAAASDHRLANLSLADNWHRSCAPRCDPTGRAPASTCDAPAVRAQIRSGGQALAALVAELNRRAPFLVVVAAGNDSGNAAMTDACGQPATELGDFPAALASGVANAALEWPDARDHMLVVSAHTQAGERASFANSGADVWAPGQDIAVLASGGGMVRSRGTSLAAPLVTGAAAFLLAVEPALTNPELRRLLTSEATTDPVGQGAGRRVNLMKALLELDAVHPGRPPEDAVLLRLADMDDGSRDGFERFVWSPTGVRGDVWVDDALGSDGAVDFRDFRRLRDTIAMAASNLPAEGDIGHPKHDLNGDGDSVEPFLELSPIANLDTYPFVDADDLTSFRRVYVPDEPQRWLAVDLPTLLVSVDLRIYAANAIAALGASSVVLTIEGATPRTPPSDLSPLRALPTSPAEDGLVLTTPLTSQARVRWYAVCADQTLSREHVVELGELVHGQDRAVVLVAEGASPCCQGPDCSPTTDPRLAHEYIDIRLVNYDLAALGWGWSMRYEHHRTMHRDREGNGAFLNENIISVWNEAAQAYDTTVTGSVKTCLDGHSETRSFTSTNDGPEETTDITTSDGGCNTSLAGHPVPYCFYEVPVACQGETLTHDDDNGIQRFELTCLRMASGALGPDLGICN